MPLACKICIAAHGLKGSEIGSLPKTEEELFDHIEKEHHIIVRREGESPQAAQERFYSKYPEARDEKTCKCPTCSSKRELKEGDQPNAR